MVMRAAMAAFGAALLSCAPRATPAGEGPCLGSSRAGLGCAESQTSVAGADGRGDVQRPDASVLIMLRNLSWEI